MILFHPSMKNQSSWHTVSCPDMAHLLHLDKRRIFLQDLIRLCSDWLWFLSSHLGSNGGHSRIGISFLFEQQHLVFLGLKPNWITYNVLKAELNYYWTCHWNIIYHDWLASSGQSTLNQVDLWLWPPFQVLSFYRIVSCGSCKCKIFKKPDYMI